MARRDPMGVVVLTVRPVGDPILHHPKKVTDQISDIKREKYEKEFMGFLLLS